MIGIDPLGEGKRSDPAFMAPYYFKHAMRALQMKRIPLAGQDIDWIQKVFIGRPRTCPIDSSQLP